MSIQVTVAGLSKRDTIKVAGPMSPLYQILEDFCKKHELDPTRYQLKTTKGTKKSALDLSLPWRLSGLNNNTTLEIIAKKSGKVGKATLGVQLVDGTRFKENIPLDRTLWQVLKIVEQNHTAEKVNITQVITKSNRTYCIPVVTVMNNSFGTFDALGNTTLSQLGLSDGGNALLKLSFADTNQTFEQVVPKLAELNTTMQQLEQKTQTIPSAQSSSTAQSSTVTSSSTTVQSSVNTTAPTQNMEVDEEEEEEEEEEEQQKVISSLENTVATDIKLYYTPQTTSTVVDNEDISDADFELTTSELKQILAKQETLKENDILKTRKMRELEAEKKRRIYDKTLIRVRFPTMDGLILQGTFKPTHVLRDVRDFVLHVLADPQVPFYMQIAPPVKRFNEADMSITLKDLKLGGAAIINIFVDKNHPASANHSDLAIKSDLLSYLQQIQQEKTPDSLNKPLEQPVLPIKKEKKSTPKWFKR